MTSPQQLSTEVLIVGGGPVGLALANELGLRGIKALLVEQHDRVGSQPRAKTTNVRTMEHMRRWGLAEKVRQASPLPRGYPTDVFFLTRLFGYELARFENAFNGYTAKDERYSEQAQWIPQYIVESVLREGLERRPSVEVRFGTRLDSVLQSDEGVEAKLTQLDDGSSIVVRAVYVVGADGARSAVREMVGAKLEGQHGLAHHYNTIIRIPEFADHPPHQKGIMYWLVNPESPAVMTPMDNGHTWTFGTTLKENESELSEEELRRRIFKAVGREIGYEIVAVDRWSGHRLIADRYRDRRVFLAGDACHLHPPFGGFGMNMGVGDAVDLGWKLAAVLRNWGGPRLLDSYEQERRPVHLRVLQVSVQNYSVLSQHLVRDNLESGDAGGDSARRNLATEIVSSKAQEFKSLGVVLGSHYSGSPIVVADDTEPPPPEVMVYTPSAHPGCLAPHLWLDETTSLYDRFDLGFTVLVTERSAEADGRRLLEAAKAANLPAGLLVQDNARLRDLYGCGLALIRPDQHIAWRGDRLPGDLDGVIGQVCGFVSSRKVSVTAASLAGGV